MALRPVTLSTIHSVQQQGAMSSRRMCASNKKRALRRVSAQLNFYEILEIDPGASQDEVKRAFRQRAKVLHPDVNRAPDADKAFRLLKRAADVLSDKMLRMEHDRQLDLPSARASDPRCDEKYKIKVVNNVTFGWFLQEPAAWNSRLCVISRSKLVALRFARFERWRREVVPDLRMQLDVWGNEIYLILATAADTLTTLEQQGQDLLQGPYDHSSQQAIRDQTLCMQGVLQYALSNAQRLYDKRYQQVEVRYPAYPAIVWYDVWEEVSEEWLEASRKLEQAWRPRIQYMADAVAGPDDQHQ